MSLTLYYRGSTAALISEQQFSPIILLMLHARARLAYALKAQARALGRSARDRKVKSERERTLAAYEYTVYRLIQQKIQRGVFTSL